MVADGVWLGVIDVQTGGIRGLSNAGKWCVIIRFMSKFCGIVCFCLIWQQAGAQVDLPEGFRNEVQQAQSLRSSVSASGQFIIHNAPEDLWRLMDLSPSLMTNYARFDAPVLAVSCERIKSALLAQLGASDEWQGRVSIFLHQARRLDETIVIGSTADGHDWTYYMNLPDTVERRRLVSAVVDVLLLEMSERNSGRAAEIPKWLAQGLSQQLVNSSMPELVVDTPEGGNSVIRGSTRYVEGTNAAPLERAHEVLLARPPLTFGELSWPNDGEEESEVYRSSAQLLVCSLLQLEDGRPCLRKMIRELPQHLNWQLSLLDAFQSDFSDQRELEKWWDLRLVNFTGRDLSETWPHDVSARKLDEIIRAGAQVRTAADELPLRSEVTLQSIIGDWGYSMQEGVLREKIRQLDLLRASVSQDLVGLVDDYREVLVAYVKTREKAGAFRSTTVERFLGPDRTALETIRQLNLLDAEREAMRNSSSPAGEAAANASVSR
jgi:hypothetical protein